MCSILYWDNIILNSYSFIAFIILLSTSYKIDPFILENRLKILQIKLKMIRFVNFQFKTTRENNILM